MEHGPGYNGPWLRLKQSPGEGELQDGIDLELVDKLRYVIVLVLVELVDIHLLVVLVDLHLTHELTTEFYAKTETVLGNETAVTETKIGTKGVDTDVALHITITVEVYLILVDLGIYLILGSLGHVGSGHEVLYVLTVTGDFGNLLAARRIPLLQRGRFSSRKDRHWP